MNLKSFTGELKSGQCSLQWIAECTDPNTSFTVQHSTDGKTFTNLQEVKAKGTQSNTYQVTDPNPAPGKNFYRLLIHETAQTIYSNIVLVRNAKAGLVINKLYPNPVNQPMLIVELSAAQNYSGTINIVTLSGLSIMSRETHFKKGDMQLWLPVDMLPEGQYFLSIRYGDAQTILRTFSK